MRTVITALHRIMFFLKKIMNENQLILSRIVFM